MVMKLVTQLGAKGKTLEKLRRELEAQKAEQEQLDKENALADEEDEPGDNEAGNETEAVAKKPKKKKKVCITASVEKLRMKLNEINDSYAVRQALVRVLFTRFLATRQYFNYTK